MSGNEKWFRRYVMSLSYNERRTRKLLRYRERIKALEAMDFDELNFEYVYVRSAFEYKKGILMVLMVFMLLFFRMDVWRYFFLSVGLELALILVMVMMVYVVLFLVMNLREFSQLRKDLLIIEIVREKLLL